MISLLPAYHETFVLPKPAEEVYRQIASATSNKPFLQSDEQNLFFNGWVKEERFRLSLRVRRGNHYLPLVIGQIEATSSGSILLVDYKLFPTTRLLLTLWTIILTLGAFIGFYQLKSMFFLAGGLGIMVIIHGIVWSNFKLHLTPTRNALHRVVS